MSDRMEIHQNARLTPRGREALAKVDVRIRSESWTHRTTPHLPTEGKCGPPAVISSALWQDYAGRFQVRHRLQIVGNKWSTPFVSLRREVGVPRTCAKSLFTVFPVNLIVPAEREEECPCEIGRAHV